MAVNRLFLTCRYCRDTRKDDADITIARLQVGMDEWLPSRVPAEEFEQWLAKHVHCAEADYPDIEHTLGVTLSSENTRGVLLDHQIE